MNTKSLMAVSAVLMGLAGITFSFFPQEFASYFNIAGANIVLLQLLGALYFSFAILNWTAKANLTGGIYSRPVAMGNLTQFVIGGLVLLKFATHNINLTYIWIAAIVYLVFAILFGFVLFTNPVMKNTSV
jgi:hypothetical protein